MLGLSVLSLRSRHPRPHHPKDLAKEDPTTDELRPEESLGDHRRVDPTLRDSCLHIPGDTKKHHTFTPVSLVP